MNGGSGARRRRYLWLGRGVFAGITLALIAYLSWIGLDRADKVASTEGAVLALLALGAPHLLPADSGRRRVRRTEDELRDPAPAVEASGEGGIAIGRDNYGSAETSVRREDRR